MKYRNYGQNFTMPKMWYLRYAEHHAKNRTSLRGLDHNTLFFGWPVIYQAETNMMNTYAKVAINCLLTSVTKLLLLVTVCKKHRSNWARDLKFSGKWGRTMIRDVVSARSHLTSGYRSWKASKQQCGVKLSWIFTGGESHLHGAGAGRPRKLSKTQEKQVVKTMENKSGSSLRETLLKRCKDASKESRRQYRATTT